MQQGTRKRRLKVARKSVQYGLSAFLMAGAISGTAALAQDIPDTVFTLGVSARAEGMGGAQSALSFDSAATLYNPAGLAFVTTRELMVTARTQPDINTFLSGNVSAPNTFRDASTGDWGLGYVGFAMPVGRAGRRAAIGVSYGRIGRYSETQSGNLATGEPANPSVNRSIRNNLDTDLVTVAYGWQPDANRRLNLGAGIVIATQRYSSTTSDVFTDPTLNTSQSVSESGTGVGLIVGVQSPGPQWSWSASFRTEISSRSSLFRVPARLTVGGAYLIFSTGSPESTGSELIAAVDVDTYFRANSGIEGRRRAVTNFHAGLEYALYQRSFMLPVRVGIRTNSAGNERIFTDTNQFTVGVGYRPYNQRYGIDLGFGFGDESVEQTTVTVSYRFE